MQVKVLTKTGQDSGEVIELSPSIFEIEPNDHAIYMDVRSILANQRQGTHKVKTRGEVRGGGRKPYRQKGTGSARRGSQRSPLLPGGGSIFGPKPHDYVVKINRKMKQLARKSALSYKARAAEILVVEDFTFEQIKTKEMATVLKNLGLNEKKTLFLTAGKNEVLYKSGRNIPYLEILEAQKASTYDILNCKMLLMQKSAVKVLEETLSMN